MLTLDACAALTEACGVTGLAAGYAIGIVGDACVRAYIHESRVFVSMVLILIFACVRSAPFGVANSSEVLGLYGLIVALILNANVPSPALCIKA